MTRFWVVLAACGLIIVPATAQPPGGGPPRFQLGSVLPPPVRAGLGLNPDQEKQIAALEKDVKERLEKILTARQLKQIEEMRPRGPGGPGGGPPGGPPMGERPERSERPRVDAADVPAGLVQNPRFADAGPDGKTPAHYALTGDVAWAVAGRADEFTDRGVAFHSHRPAGAVAPDGTGF